MEDLAISSSSAAGTTSLAVTGEVDHGTAPTLDAAVAADGVDQEAGARVVVTNPSEHCRRLLTATNLTHLLGGD